MVGMTSNRPYLIRAIYDWLVDNNQTPHLLVDAAKERVVVPLRFVQDGHIVLNVSPGAVRNIHMGNDAIMFSARFSGATMEIYIPTSAVLGIYAKENGLGMMFPDAQEAEATANAPEPQSPVKGGSGRPTLTIVK